jgi:hypothetical protein
LYDLISDFWCDDQTNSREGFSVQATEEEGDVGGSSRLSLFEDHDQAVVFVVEGGVGGGIDAQVDGRIEACGAGDVSGLFDDRIPCGLVRAQVADELDGLEELTRTESLA